MSHTNTINNFKISSQKITSTYLTKGVPLLYNVGIMNKTTTKTTNKTKPKPKSEDDMLIEGVACTVGLLLGFLIGACVVSSVPGWGLLAFFFLILGGVCLL